MAAVLVFATQYVRIFLALRCREVVASFTTLNLRLKLVCLCKHLAHRLTLVHVHLVDLAQIVRPFIIVLHLSL